MYSIFVIYMYVTSGYLLLVTSGCSAASNWQPGPHAVSTIVCSSWNPSCC